MLRRYSLLALCLLVSPVASFTSPSTARPALTQLEMAKKKGFSKQETPKKKPQPVEATTTTTTAAPEQPAQLNAGQRALEKMRREQAEAKDAELRRVREMLQEDQQVQETAAAIPEKVAARMGKRMLPFVGLPLFLGMGSFVAFWYMATYKEMSFEPSMVAASTILILVFGLLVSNFMS